MQEGDEEETRSESHTVSTIYPDDSASARYGAGGGGRGSDDAASIISFRSSLDGQLFREMWGRSFTNSSDGYYLPADDMEHSRLDLQHHALRLHLNSLYVQKNLVEHTLRRDQRHDIAIADLGTGSGRWPFEMAQRFPHCEVVGIDLIPPSLVRNPDVMPDNLRYEVDDVNLPMDHYAGVFTLVHTRSVDAGVHDFDLFLYETAKMLRPDGVLLVSAGFAEVYDENHVLYPIQPLGAPHFCWTHWMLSSAKEAYLQRGNTGINAPLLWHDWLVANPNFRDVVTEDIYVPLGPWKRGMNEREKLASNVMRENIAQIMYAVRPLLLSVGKDPCQIDHGIQESIKELRDLRFRGHLRWRYSTAIRVDEAWQEKLEMPPSEEGGSSDDARSRTSSA